MDLISYCRCLGIQLATLPPIGEWTRHPTDDKPGKRNGSVKYLGTHAFVQNMATMADIAVWKPEDGDNAPTIDHAEVARVIALQAAERAQAAEKAARTAGWILHQCRPESHQYLIDKGFPLEQGNVWTREKDGERHKFLVIPMRVDGHVVGCQLICKDGQKRFLKGQRTDGAVYVIENKGRPILVEGYAKAVAARLVLQALRMRYKIVVCFSAGNMAKIAATLPDCFIIADNDELSQQVQTPGGMGRKVATESGRPFWISERVGQDFDKFVRDVGVFRASQALRSAMQ